MRLWILTLASVLASADSLKLRNGETIDGVFLSGTATAIRFEGKNGKPRQFPLDEVESIAIAARMAPTPSAAVKPGAPPVMIPAGTTVSVKLIDGVDVDTTSVGQLFRASIDDPINVAGNTAVPRGTPATVQAVKVAQSGRMKGSDEVSLKLYRIVLNGKTVDVASSYAEMKSAGEGKKTARKTFGGAGLGAIIGGIAGGGAGAAIGAVAGGAGGAALSATGQAHLKIPPETRLQFQLTSAVKVN